MQTLEAMAAPSRQEATLFAYHQQDFDNLLYCFAFQQPLSARQDIVPREVHLEVAMQGYSEAVAKIATIDGWTDLQVVGSAFNDLIDGMDIVASEMLGFEKPRSRVEAMLIARGRRDPIVASHFHGLDREYWQRQFPREYKRDRDINSNGELTEKEYLAAKIYQTFKNFALVPFSYLPGSTKGYGITRERPLNRSLPERLQKRR
jgi:hypothetical protein